VHTEVHKYTFSPATYEIVDGKGRSTVLELLGEWVLVSGDSVLAILVDPKVYTKLLGPVL
jgi:hypothetical protein